MPAKEIKELRQAGKLEEAYAMAKAELEADLSNIWCKRNLSWVLYAQLDELAPNLDAFIEKINEVKELDLPAAEEMFFENISIVISKAARVITHEATLDINKIHRLFDSIKELSIKRNSKWFSVLFNAMHKGMKESNRYIEFADWWDFKNFRPEDFQKEKLPNGKEVMAIVEQAYIAYAKHLLPQQTQYGEVVFNKEKAENFLPVLSQIVDDYPQFQYPAYFKAKLLLALGNKDNMLESLLPFAKKKRNDFWVWQILSEAFSSDEEKVFACYCKALSCKSPEEMLVGLRQKMARMLISRKLYNEARTEIDLLVHARTEHSFKIPTEVTNWQGMDWYKTAVPSKSNFGFFKSYVPIAEALLFSDVPEESVIVEFVNADKKILNFIASETKFGFFKYDRFFSDVKVGDTLKVRFQGGSNEGMHQLYTAVKENDDLFKKQYIKEVSGGVKIPQGKSFGFIEDVFVHPSLVIKLKLTDGMSFVGKAIKSYNQEKSKWTWKLF
jgi:tetratricopeptide (TPR) repeat protein